MASHVCDTWHAMCCMPLLKLIYMGGSNSVHRDKQGGDKEEGKRGREERRREREERRREKKK